MPNALFTPPPRTSRYRISRTRTLPILTPETWSRSNALPSRCGSNTFRDLTVRIILSNIGTLGDINPLIAIALELKRRGHVPVMTVPAVYELKIKPLGLEFHAIRPDIDPTNSVLVEMIYDVKHGTEHGLRDFLFPSLRETYADLLHAATQPQRADLLL